MKKILVSVLSVALVAVLSIAGTIAYLTYEDSDVNVMTLGNVKIEQIEQEWDSENTNLVEFTQNKPLYPAVGEVTSENNSDDAYRSLELNNVVDKYVSVKNIGSSDAYVRTSIAFEMGTLSEAEVRSLVKPVINDVDSFPGTWYWEETGVVVEIDGHNYYVMTATHKNPVAPGETTIPSLLQVYLSSTATNEDCVALDGNGNGMYDILVKSQAIQTAGFDGYTAARSVDFPARAALNEGFGYVTSINHPWDDGASIHVSSAEEFVEAVKLINSQYNKTTDTKQNVRIILNGDIIFDDDSHFMVTNSSGVNVVIQRSNVTLDLNGHNIIAEETDLMSGKTQATGLIAVRNGRLDIIGEGSIITKNQAIAIYAWENCEVNIYGGNYISNGYLRKESAVYANNYTAMINVYGGIYANTNMGFNAHNTNCKNVVIVLHEGIEFFDYQNHFVDDYNGGRIAIAEGCTYTTTEINGQTLYKIVGQ